VTTDLAAVCAARAELISKSLSRHRLVFVQLGAAFDPLRDGICAQLKGQCVSIDDRSEWNQRLSSHGTLIVTDLERCVEMAGDVLGEVRAILFSLLDGGKAVCLLSRAPRLSYRPVPGSSVLEDAALVTLPLLAMSEIQCEPGGCPIPGWPWPSVSFGRPFGTETYEAALREVGQGIVAALDHALFEVDPKGTDGLEFLAARELEGLRGCGIVAIDEGGQLSLALPQEAKFLREALAAHVSETVAPAASLAEVTRGLWFIERKIRQALRAAAIAKYSDGWRASAVGGLHAEILRRAQLDTNVTAKSVTDLRDPLEWLTLGELMDMVRSAKFSNLGIDAAIWRKFQEQVVPVRNRLAHVRMLKSEDAEVVSMWAKMIRLRFH
jgi:hypothetical protein